MVKKKETGAVQAPGKMSVQAHVELFHAQYVATNRNL